MLLMASNVVFGQATYYVELKMYIKGPPNSYDCEHNADMRFRTNKLNMDMYNPSPGDVYADSRTETISIDDNTEEFYLSGRNRYKEKKGCNGDDSYLT